jgi:hypothetical protein
MGGQLFMGTQAGERGRGLAWVSEGRAWIVEGRVEGFVAIIVMADSVRPRRPLPTTTRRENLANK